MKKITTVIFDLDGTLLDTLSDLHRCVNHALRAGGFPEQTSDHVRRALGNGYRFLIEQCLPASASESDTTDTLAVFEDFYNKHSMDTTRPYDQIPETIDALLADGYKTAIVSNKGMAAAQELARYFFAGKIATVIGECATVRRKPAPDSVVEAMRLLGSTKEESLYIGDSEVDIATAHNAGMECLSVSWGFRTTEHLKAAGATHIIDFPAQIVDFLRTKQ